MGIGFFVGNGYWTLLASYYAPLWTQGIFVIVIGFGCAIYGYNTYDEANMVDATAFFGANLIAYSILLYTQGALGNFGFLGVQITISLFVVCLGVNFQEEMR